ncbi:MAG TPA: VWA domain-containing protein, partial [Nocardioides sp.]|nr:VWA domain-containing protein [Nocardioides sp.]
MSLVDRHIQFLEALRGAGMSVSLAEDLDALRALRALTWDDRSTVRAGYAATLVKKQAQRPTFDALFDVYFPRMVGDGAAGQGRDEEPDTGVRDNAEALTGFRDQLVDALVDGERQAMAELAAEMVARFGAMPGRGPGLSSWSAYTALQRVAPAELTDRIVEALLAQGRSEDDGRRDAARRIGALTALVEGDARRRIAEEKGPDHVAAVAVRPTIDRLDFTAARKADLEEMRREIYPLARRLATRLTQEHHARRRGPLDFRRTVRASMSTGGVPLTTHHKPKRPHRTELVVLCDVSGSVANFAQFTLLLVYALREQFGSVRAFTFIDHVHEVTSYFTPGADPADVMADLAA